jgi:DNA-binding CsgD family transcriptional regulator
LQVETVESEDADGWRQIARDHGFESLIAVPLHHRETVYGVLVVYAGRSDAFSERERHGFEVLGKTVGLALDAIERRRLLFADAVTELELRVTAPGSFLSQASEEFECRLSVSEYVSVEDHWHLFVDIDDGDIGTLADYASHHPAVEGRRVISTDGGPDRLEVVVGEGSIFDHIVPTGVDIRSLKFHGGLGMVVVDAPAEVAVRDVVEKLHSTFHSVELLSRQEKDRPIEPSRDRSETVDMLTERQREVLKVAYYAGYFSWPRANTAETIAEMLGIAAPTFHAHIRKAEDVLLSNVFE